MKKLLGMFLIVVVFGLYGCGDTNFFSWVHEKGKDDSIAALKADGDSALADKDYEKAYEYYSKVLEKNPKDSAARYGRAQAAYGKAGISLSKILASALDSLSDSDGSSIIADPNLVSSYSLVVSNALNASGQDLFPVSSEELTKLYEANEIVIVDLKYIADGNAEGVIPADDPDVNVNLAVALTLQAALLVLDSNGDKIPNDSGDVVNIDSDYEIQDDGISGLNSSEKAVALEGVRKAIVYVVGSQRSLEVIDKMPSDLSAPFNGAIHYLDVVINSDSVGKTDALKDLRNVIDDFYNATTGNDLKWLWGKY